jgi:aspartate kinase
VDSRKAIVTDGEHTAAAPRFEETTAALMTHADPPLAAGRIPVLGGFVGATAAGMTTTLGRGGSDFSAAIVGACLGASEIQIWTDVDGMLTADPRIVDKPQVVPHLSFAEASELAYFGAKVLHPATIQPAVSRNIPVRILNSHRATARGTLITAERPSCVCSARYTSPDPPRPSISTIVNLPSDLPINMRGCDVRGGTAWSSAAGSSSVFSSAGTPAESSSLQAFTDDRCLSLGSSTPRPR